MDVEHRKGMPICSTVRHSYCTRPALAGATCVRVCDNEEGAPAFFTLITTALSLSLYALQSNNQIPAPL